MPTTFFLPHWKVREKRGRGEGGKEEGGREEEPVKCHLFRTKLTNSCFSTWKKESRKQRKKVCPREKEEEDVRTTIFSRL